MYVYSYDWGPWRVVMSNKLGKPFFYNTDTKIGQFAIPDELKMVPFDDEEEEEDDDDDDVVDVDDDDDDDDDGDGGRVVEHTSTEPHRC